MKKTFLTRFSAFQLLPILPLLSILSLLSVLTFSCQHEAAPELIPPYEDKISFSCRDTPGEYYTKAAIGQEPLCYSSADPLYMNFALVGKDFMNDPEAPDHASPIMGKNIRMGLGGLCIHDDSFLFPSPTVFLFIETPAFQEEPEEFISTNFYEGASLDILSTDASDKSLTELNKKYSINLYTRYPGQDEEPQTTTFQSSSGDQDPETAYLTVTEFKEKEDGSYDISVRFRCKLYDEELLFRELKEGEMRFNLNLK